MIKVRHDLFEFFLSHLPMASQHPGFRDQLFYLIRALLNVFDLIMQVVDLAASQQFSLHRFFDNGQIPRPYERFYGQATGGWCRDDREVS